MRNKLTGMMLAVAALGLVGCSDKLADDVLQSSQEGVTDGSVTFKISSVDNQTRATRATDDDPETKDKTEDVKDGFDKGQTDEYAITKDAGANVVFLFDNQGKYVSKSDLQVLSDPTSVNDPEKGSSSNHTETDGSGYHEKQDDEMYFNARIRKTKNGEDLKCVMILNANPSRLTALSNSLEVSSTTLDTFLLNYEKWEEASNRNLGQYKGTDGKTYFTMSNTVYVKGSDAPGDIQCPITITDKDIYTTAQEAKKNPVTVHVERLAAKFSLSYTGTNNTNGLITMEEDNILHTLESSDLGEEVEPVEWAVKILNWDVNGTETEIYWTKNLKYSGTNVYNAQDGAIGNWPYGYGWGVKNGWNDPSRVRSYWAVDPHYKTGRYPEQYRQIIDIPEDDDAGTTTTHDTGIPTGGAKNALNYITYNNVLAAANEDYRYAPENTFDELDFMTTTSNHDGFKYIGNDYKRAATHILVAAELQLKKNGVLTAFDGYCYENIYWWATEAGNGKVANEELIKYMARNVIDEYEGDVFVDQTGTNINTTNYSAYFEFKDNGNTTSDSNGATIKGGDGRVMLKLKDGVTLYVKKDNGEGYETINEKKLKKAIYTAGTAKHYNQGQMYYAIPIKHMASISEVSTNESDSDHGKTLYNTGSYGVVRNHWYKINITEIKVPGVPVDDPNQPIIPNDDPDEGGYIAFEIVIIPWHVIEQNVEF